MEQNFGVIQDGAVMLSVQCSVAENIYCLNCSVPSFGGDRTFLASIEVSASQSDSTTPSLRIHILGLRLWPLAVCD